MPLDAFFLSALKTELTQTLIGCRIDRIQQPERDTVILHLRRPGFAGKLLLSASGNHPRIHLTEYTMENPAQPPMFCMLLRKHLTGGKLRAITQPPMERLLEVCFDCTNEMGEAVEKKLILELIGRNSNLLLLGGDGRIIDCLRRVDPEMSAERQLLPGLFYHLPSTRQKLCPSDVSEQQIFELLQAQTGEKHFDSWLLDTFGGFSPLVCRELSYRLFHTTEQDLSLLSEQEKRDCAKRLFDFFSHLAENCSTPTLLLQNGERKDFSCLPVLQYEGFYQTAEKESFCALLDDFYAERDRAERIRSKTAAIRKTLTTLCERTARKLQMQRAELEKTKDREQLRRKADIVTANLYAISRGQAILDATDFYDPEMKPIRIALDPTVSAQQNAAKFYKEYQKAKTAEKVLAEQISLGESELLYLKSTLDCLSRVQSERDVAEIREELIREHYLRPNGNKKQMKLPPSKPMEFVSSDGFSIFVGKNNQQNDLLTLKLARKNDIWLHTQKIHGSHVIILAESREIPDKTFTEAAMLAAYHSQARGGQNVPVDCTSVKNVKKPAGAKPGMVIYDHYRTIFVTPDPEVIEKLKKKG